MLNSGIFPITWRLIPVGLAIILVFIALPQLINLLLRLGKWVVASEIRELYQKIVHPQKDLLQLIILLLAADGILLITKHLIYKAEFIGLIEIPVGLCTAFVVAWLGYRSFERFFQIYLTTTALSGRKVNEQLLIVSKFLSVALFFLTITIIFSQVHQINILSLIASLGIGGVAVAFAAQKTLEQLLGGIVIYLDRPFIIDDYIGLPDGTFGKVESIGLRSTRIRTSGKGTLMVVPNNYLTGINVENFTGAKKEIAILRINFDKYLPENKKSFVRQLYLEATVNTEIDSRNFTIDFEDYINSQGEEVTKSQVKFFMYSTGKLSHELRLQIIHIVGENIKQKLIENGIKYETIEEIWVDSKISV